MTKVEIAREKREAPEIKKKDFVSRYIGKNKTIRVWKTPNTNIIEKLENHSRDIIDECSYYENGKIKLYQGHGVYVDTIMTAEWYEDGTLKYLSAQTNKEPSKHTKLIYRVKKDEDNNIINMASFVDNTDNFNIKYYGRRNFQLITPTETVTVKDDFVRAYSHDPEWFNTCVYIEKSQIDKKKYFDKCKQELKNANDFIGEYEPFAKKRCERLLFKYLKMINDGEEDEYKNTIIPDHVYLPRYKYIWCKNDRTTVLPIDE